ncbi:MAG TPA: sigma-70 family RNA polymerase sigma factor, partial [Burkholderiaceae bacterium]|nr:sigma-70 family RNA polymerase sigma factor [Burkholderiaceae bacterium]
MYTAKGQLQDSNALLKQYSPLVRRLAHQMIAKLPANVELDDLIQVGMIGLNDALSRFDANQGVQFETFATQRIRGAMLDELRGGDWMSRGDRRHQRAIESAVHKLEQKLQRAPNESEIADEMGMLLADYQELLGKVRGTQLFYLEDLSGDDGD